MRVDTNIVMFPNPLEQCLRRKRLLKTFLQHYNLPEHLPVFSRIIFTSHVTILSVSESYKEMVLERVWRREAVVSKIESLNRQHSQCLITVKEMYRFARIVANHHLPAWFSPLKSFGLEFGNLRSGMYCERCLDLHFTKKSGTRIGRAITVEKRHVRITL